MRGRYGLLMLGAAALAVAACQGGDGNTSANAGNEAGAGAGPAAKSGDNLAQALGRAQGLSRFVAAMKGAGLDGLLSGASPYTFFAPDDAAFGKLGADGEALLQPQAKGRLMALITAHIIPGIVTAKDLDAALDKGGGKAKLATLAGTSLTATRDGSAIVLEDGKGGKARIVDPEVAGSNGIVHRIDTALAPQ